MRSPMMTELAALDPALGMRAPGHGDDSALQAILATDRRVSASRRRRPALRAGVAAAAVVAVGAALLVTSPWSAAPAYASWTSVPQAQPADVVASRAARCAQVAHRVEGGDDPGGAEAAQVVTVALEPVVTDSRGEYTYVVLAGEGALGECLVTVPAKGEPDVVSSDSVLTPDATRAEAVVPGAREVTTLSSGTASWSTGSTGEGALSSAYGRAGADVTGVDLALTDGGSVHATVQDGWWAVWAPGGSSLGDSAVLTYSDGTTTAVTIRTASTGG